MYGWYEERHEHGHIMSSGNPRSFREQDGMQCHHHRHDPDTRRETVRRKCRRHHELQHRHLVLGFLLLLRLFFLFLLLELWEASPESMASTSSANFLLSEAVRWSSGMSASVRNSSTSGRLRTRQSSFATFACSFSSTFCLSSSFTFSSSSFLLAANAEAVRNRSEGRQAVPCGAPQTAVALVRPGLREEARPLPRRRSLLVP